MKDLFRQLTIVGVLGSTILSPTLSWSERIHEDLKVSRSQPLSHHEEHILTSTAAKVLRSIVQARTAIHDHHMSQAETDLHQAQTLIALVKEARPTARIRDHIWVAQHHLDYESTEKVALDLIPIDMALTELAYVVPVEEARSHLAKAHNSLSKEDKPAAKAHLEAMGRALLYTEVDLPLSATEQHVLKAQTFLLAHKTKEADDELAAAEDGVAYISISMDSPMTHAKRSLWAAMKAYTSGELTAAKAHLQKATSWLDRLGHDGEKTLDTETHQLAAEMHTLLTTIEQGGETVQTSLQTLWKKMTALSEREAERVAAGADNQRAYATYTALKVNLIEAKFHVSYAETYALMTHDQKRALTELEQAQKHLNAALEEALPPMKEKIEAANQASIRLQQALGSKNPPGNSAFASLQVELHHLVDTLPMV